MSFNISSGQSREHNESVVNKHAYVSDENLSMDVYDNYVGITLTSTNSSTITLPSVVEAAGGTYSIELVSVGTGLVTISDKSNDAGFSDVNMSNAGDKLILFSDGHTWTEVVNNIQTFEVFDDFLMQTLTEADTPWILNSGSDAQAIDAAVQTAEEGTIRITTGDADGTTANDASQVVGSIPVQADSGGLFMEARLKCVTNVNTMSLCVGFTDVSTLEEPFTNSADTITSNATDAACFLYDTDATTDYWWAVAVDTDVDDTGNAATSSLPVADTYQTLRIEVSPDGNTIKYFVDGSLVATRNSGGISPSTNLYPTVIACATTTSSKSVDIDYIKYGHNR